MKNLLSKAQKTVVTSSSNLEREAQIQNCMILRCSKFNWVLNLVFKEHEQQKVTSWSGINRIANTELKPHPYLRCNPFV